jgi:hypothetical protein
MAMTAAAAAQRLAATIADLWCRIFFIRQQREPASFSALVAMIIPFTPQN